MSDQPRGGGHSMPAKLLTEFVGTFFLVLVIGLFGFKEVNPAPVAVGFSLMALVYMGGHVSGAHYNPAVTIAIFLRGRIGANAAVAYMLVQILAGTIAAITVRGLTGPIMNPPMPTIGSAGAMAVEALFTFALALVVLNVATAEGTKGNSFYGLAIGAVVMAGAFAGGGLSGGAFNPAVGLGPALGSVITGGPFGAHVWIYLVGPVIGGAAAAMAFRLQGQE